MPELPERTNNKRRPMLPVYPVPQAQAAVALGGSLPGVGAAGKGGQGCRSVEIRKRRKNDAAYSL